MPRETSQTRKENRAGSQGAKGSRTNRGNNKGNKKKRTFYNIIIVILLIVIAFSLFQIGKILWGYYHSSKTYANIAEIAGVESEKDDKVNFDELLKQNPDTKAWIKREDIGLNYPVMQAKDNDYYLYRLFNGEYSKNGSLFIDYRNENPFKDFLTIIYGHHMKDGSMFAPIMKYRAQDFYDKHKKLHFYTPEQNYNLVIVAAAYIDASASQYKFYFNEAEKASYVEWLKSHSVIDTGEEITTEDHLVMLSTCVDASSDNRFVVYGKLVPKK